MELDNQEKLTIYEQLVTDDIKITQLKQFKDKAEQLPKEDKELLEKYSFSLGFLALFAIRYAELTNKIPDNNRLDLKQDEVTVIFKFNEDEYFRSDNPHINHKNKYQVMNNNGSMNDLETALSILIPNEQLYENQALVEFLERLAEDYIDEFHYKSENQIEDLELYPSVLKNDIFETAKDLLKDELHEESFNNFTHLPDLIKDTLNELIGSPELVMDFNLETDEVLEKYCDDIFEIHENCYDKAELIGQKLQDWKRVFEILQENDFSFTNDEMYLLPRLSIGNIEYRNDEFIDNLFKPNPNETFLTKIVLKDNLSLQSDKIPNEKIKGTIDIHEKLVKYEVDKENNVQEIERVMNFETQFITLVSQKIISHPDCPEQLKEMMCNLTYTSEANFTHINNSLTEKERQGYTNTVKSEIPLFAIKIINLEKTIQSDNLFSYTLTNSNNYQEFKPIIEEIFSKNNLNQENNENTVENSNSKTKFKI